jgi:hypothetical protein
LGGASAAFVVASHEELRERIVAIVSRSGRPDLAIQNLPLVGAPSLLIVGEKDDKKIIRINKHVLKKIGSKEKRLVLIPGAIHLFEEAGTLEQVRKLSSDWFRRYLPI